jgi:hypothetical protein
MKSTLSLAVVMALFAAFAHAQDVAGDWLGALKSGDSEVRLVLHIVKANGGGYEATVDSIDQNIKAMPVSAVSLQDSKLTFVVAPVSGSFEGKVNAAGTAITGTWSQGLPFSLDFHRLTASLKTTHTPAKPSDIDGAWGGRLEAQGGARLVFHFVNTEDGLTATVDSPDQNLNGWPVPVVKRDGSSIRLEVRQVGAAYEGKISSDLATIEGTWGSPGHTWRLVLRRVKDKE